MKSKIILLVIILVTMVGCGPMYKTLYHYHAPNDPQGRQCINSCDFMRQQCNSGCHDRKQNCEITAQAMDAISNAACYNRQSYCRSHHGSGCLLEHCGHHSNSHSQCSSYDCKQSCEYQYNQCFTNCGGSIETQQVCTSNCGN